MRRPTQARPALELMETKLLLTAQTLAGPQAALVESRGMIPKSPVVELNGTVRGGYHQHRGNPDAGTTYDLFGSGRLSGMGQTAVAGHVSTPGNLGAGQASGTLYLTDSRGSLTLRLTGPEAPGFSGLPGEFRFSVVDGTRSFRGVTDEGTLRIDLAPVKGVKVLDLNHFGKFTLSLRSDQMVQPL